MSAAGPTREQVVEWMAQSGAAPSDPLPNNYDGKVSAVEKVAALAYAAGQDAKRIEFQTEIQRLTTLAQPVAIPAHGNAAPLLGSRTVQEVRAEAMAAMREACAEEAEQAASDDNKYDIAAAIRAIGDL